MGQLEILKPAYPQPWFVSVIWLIMKISESITTYKRKFNHIRVYPWRSATQGQCRGQTWNEIKSHD